MTAQPPSGINLRGAVDLSGLRKPPARPAGSAGAAPASPAGPGAAGAGPAVGEAVPVPSLVVDVTAENLEKVFSLSGTVPIIVDLWADWCQPCKQLSPVLEKLTAEYDGRLLLAKVDVDAEQEVAAMFGAQSLPTVLAVLAGRPMMLFQGAVPEAQVREVLDKVLEVAGQNGISGRLSADADAAAPAEPQLPPLHQEAFDALDRGDLDGAAAAYRKALAENPGDAMASAGLAQVGLLRRTQGADLNAARAAAAADPDDLDAAILVSDLDLLGGHVEDAFDRLIDLLRRTFGDDRERLRVHIVELFEVVGGTDERVIAARRKLATALF